MTVIACKDGVMAADSACWSNGLIQPVPRLKIIRTNDGALIAMAGKLHDSYLLRLWVEAGMPDTAKPAFRGKDDDEPHILLAEPDGTLWFSTGDLVFAPEPQPVCIGEAYAAQFCEGAMEAGFSAPEAVAATIKRHDSAAGSVQVECLHSPTPVDTYNCKREPS